QGSNQQFHQQQFQEENMQLQNPQRVQHQQISEENLQHQQHQQLTLQQQLSPQQILQQLEQLFHKLLGLYNRQQKALEILQFVLKQQHPQQSLQEQYFLENQQEFLQIFKQQLEVYNAYAFKIQDPNYLPVNDLKITNGNEIQNKSKRKSSSYYGFGGLFSTDQQEISDLKNKLHNLQIKNQNVEAVLSEKVDHINELRKANNDLKKEATKYQSALGNATSFHLGSQDSNSGVQFSEDILKGLLEKFGCSPTGDLRKNKPLISGLLERHVIETIIKKATEYFYNQKNDVDNKKDEQDDEIQQQQSLEMKIFNVTEQLLKLTDSISKNRAGGEKVSKATSTKLRQQIYGVLGNRGFSNIILDKEHIEHPLIVNLRKDIIKLVNRYRTIKDPNRSSENEKLIVEIVRQVINVFFFRLKVQEPIADWKFFEKNTNINTIMMEASWDEMELEDLHVDACAFPIIGSNLCEVEEADEKLKAIFPAQIIPGNTTETK
ncbi:3375_t:CDS:2, partial [Funneliformis caledonium]